MNAEHLKLCASPEWADAVKRWILPWVLDDVDLGDDVLEIGPGPGLTTDMLCGMAPRLTALEINPDLAKALDDRMRPRNVEVICGDAAATKLPGGRFSSVVCLTMLHHVPSPAAQDAVFAEARRLLRDGGLLVGQDSLDSTELRELHVGDTCVPVDPATLGERLEFAGFAAVVVDVNDYAVRFRARR
jgi:SAM-dependent methyltransferase